MNEIKIYDSKLIAMAAEEKQYPSGDVLEIALAGRSNVGKSTFINKVLGRKKLAYTSSQPGKTRTVNFYEVNTNIGNLRFVDLPGYGYAKVSKSEKNLWGKRIDDYLYYRENLKIICQFIDLRHEPTALDIQMFEWLKSFQGKKIIIGTKQDKVPTTKRLSHLKTIKKILNTPDIEYFMYGADDTKSVEKMRIDIFSIIGELI